MTLFRRLWHLVNRRQRERELLAELSAHRELMPDPAAFGDPQRLLEASRDAWGWQWLDDLWQDVRFGLRSLRRVPLFAATAVSILALGIGVNVTFYQVASITLLQPRAVQSPETLVKVLRHSPRMRSPGLPYPYGAFLARENSVFSAVLMQSGYQALLDDRGEPVDVSFVTPNWFAELGYGAARGRVLSEPVDGRTDAPPVAVVSHRFWRTVLQSDDDVVGSTMRLDGRVVTVVGVARADFPEFEPDDTAFWMPMQHRAYLMPGTSFETSFAENNVVLLGRLRPGVSVAEVQDRLGAIVTVLAAAHPDQVAADERLSAFPLSEGFLDPDERRPIVAVLSVLGLLTTLVFLAAAANVGNLVLARATARSRELAVRLALGARPARLMRQLAAETLPVGIAGLLTGLVLAHVATTRLVGALGLPTWLDFSLNVEAMAVALCLTTLGLIVVGVVPGWNVSRQDLTATTKDGGQQLSRTLDRTWARRALLGAQVAASSVLLLVAGMAGRTVEQILTGDLKFDATSVAAVTAFPGRRGIVGEAAQAYWNDVRARLQGHPAVVASALAAAAPFVGNVDLRALEDVPRLRVIVQHVGPDYFTVMGVAVLQGRPFLPSDRPTDAVIVSERLAVEMFGTTDVVGKGFPRSTPIATIVGVSTNAATMLVTAPDVVELYAPLTVSGHESAQLLVRAKDDPASLLPALREAALVDPRVVPMTRLLRDDFARRTKGPVLAATILASAGVLSLALACLGVFGVVAHTVNARRQELAVHLALGASPWAVQRLVHGATLAPVLVGTFVGAVLGLPAGYALADSPLQLHATDPALFVAEIAVVLLAALLAAHLPLRRTLRLSPVRALRED